MRPQRTELEEVFIRKFMEHFRSQIDEDVELNSKITDKPDLVVVSRGKTIGIELSQLPSDYIIQHFYKAAPTPKYQKNKIVGDLLVFPFEPHRWVHEVLAKKRKKVDENRQRVGADEMWMVMHCHSKEREWPMSKNGQENSREAEALLMRFGTRQYGSAFDRIYYVYADGSVVCLRGGADAVPSAISLEQGVGFPAVSWHRFSYCFDVPLPGLGVRQHQFNDISFSELVIPPQDDFMASRDPEIERPEFRIVVEVSGTEAVWTVFRNGVATPTQRTPTGTVVGRTAYMHLNLEWNVTKIRLFPKF